MRSFFSGWRRKAGCVTLLMACAVCSAWIRSNAIADEFWFLTARRHHMIAFMFGQIVWRSTDKIEHIGLRTGWRASDIGDVGFDAQSLPEGLQETMAVLNRLSAHPRQWVVPYWTIAVPLTLLSVGLLLWKPRCRKPPGSVETEAGWKELP